MRSSIRWLYHNRGVILIAVAAVATLWLGATKQLGLFIHPRYNTFTLIAGGLGLLALMWAVTGNRDHKNDHSGLFACLLIGISMLTLLIIKPTTLSSNIANQRGINSAANTDALTKLAKADVVSPFGGNDFTQLSVKDWANLLAQTNDQAFFAGKQVSLVGFVTPDQEGSDNYFYVSRFIISCCAVDARPIGVPIHKSSWKNDYKADQWVLVEGTFKVVGGRLAIEPSKASIVDKPKDPYVY